MNHFVPKPLRVNPSLSWGKEKTGFGFQGWGGGAVTCGGIESRPRRKMLRTAPAAQGKKTENMNRNKLKCFEFMRIKKSECNSFVVTDLDVEKMGANLSEMGENFGKFSGQVCGSGHGHGQRCDEEKWSKNLVKIFEKWGKYLVGFLSTNFVTTD